MPNNLSSQPLSPDKNFSLILLASPRSGLSLLSNCLRLLGMEMSDQQATMVAEIHQTFCQELDVSPMSTDPLPDGWESSDAAKAARSGIKKLLSDLDQAAKPWMLADPFVCRTFPLWRDAFAERNHQPKVIHLLRHPWETASSLADVRQMDLQTGHDLWMIFNHEATAARIDLPYVLVTFDQLIADPLSVFSKIQSTLMLGFPNNLRAVYAGMLQTIRSREKKFNVGSITADDRATFQNYFKAYTELCVSQVSSPIIDIPVQAKRDLENEILVLTENLDEKTKQLDEHITKIKKLAQERDEKAKQAAVQKSQVEKAVKVRDEQTNLAKVRQGEIDNLKQELAEKTKLSEDRQNQINQLTKARDEQAQLVTDSQAKLDQVTQDRDQKTKQLTELQAQLHTPAQTGDEQEKIVADKQSRIEELEGKLVEMEQNYSLMVKELIKAEGQIDIIKEMLIQEPEL